jgi:hypothetical protein
MAWPTKRSSFSHAMPTEFVVKISCLDEFPVGLFNSTRLYIHIPAMLTASVTEIPLWIITLHIYTGADFVQDRHSTILDSTNSSRIELTLINYANELHYFVHHQLIRRILKNRRKQKYWYWPYACRLAAVQYISQYLVDSFREWL